MFWSKKPGPERYLDAIDDLKVKKPLSLEQLDVIYLNTVHRALTDMHWYQKRQRRWRLGSRTIRSIVFISLLIGAVIPLADAKNAHLGYIALIIGGLTFSLDKIFLVSQTWVRYMAAEMAIKTKILEFRYDFLMTRAELVDTIGESQSRKILSDFRTFLLSVHDVVKEETQTWTTQLDTALQLLGDTMKKQTKLVEEKIKAVEKEQAKIKKPSTKTEDKKKSTSVDKLIESIKD